MVNFCISREGEDCADNAKHFSRKGAELAKKTGMGYSNIGEIFASTSSMTAGGGDRDYRLIVEPRQRRIASPMQSQGATHYGRERVAR